MTFNFSESIITAQNLVRIIACFYGHDTYIDIILRIFIRLLYLQNNMQSTERAKLVFIILYCCTYTKGDRFFLDVPIFFDFVLTIDTYLFVTYIWWMYVEVKMSVELWWNYVGF